MKIRKKGLLIILIIVIILPIIWFILTLLGKR